MTTEFRAEARLDAAERGPVHVEVAASEAEREAAARRLGLSRSNLNYRINRLDIQVKEIAYD